MIIEVSVENYLSIKDKVTLSLDSSASKKLPQNLIDVSKKDKLLKSAVIYGANASGKSNIIKSVFFIWTMVKNSHAFNIDAKIPRVPFKLDESCLSNPSKFEILFIYKGIKYKYGFSCLNDKFVDEYLFYWPRGREAQIFYRTDTRDYEFKIDKRKQELIRTQMNDNVLFLSRATQLGYDKTREPYDFIINHMVITLGYSPAWADVTIRKIYENPKLKNKVIEVLKKADFGGIIDIKVNKEKRTVSEFEFKVEKDNTPPSIVNPIKQKEEDVYDIKFVHKDKSGKLIELTFTEESVGTFKTLTMLGPFFDILENGKAAFIDELESSLHPNITRFLVKLFNSKSNNGAQLIFTAHNTNLLDNELFRRDQIYICNKEPNRNTVLTSALDFDLREDADFEKAYMAGRLGGIPFIDDTLVD